MSRNTPPCGEPRPAFTSAVIARATSSRVSSSGGRRAVLSPFEPAVGLLDGVGGLRREALGDVVEHEALALVVLQDAAVAAHALGHEDAAHRERPHHAGRMELRELEVHQLGAGVVRHRDAVAGVLPRVRRDAATPCRRRRSRGSRPCSGR